MSDVSVDIIKNRSGEAPDLPSGANLSGVSTAATLQVTNLNPTHINASGVTTATTFSGSLKSTGTPTLGLGVTINSSGLNISGVATAGIVSATTLYGDGSNLTGVAMSIAPISYQPDVNDTLANRIGVSIGITFTERVIAGSGNVTLRIAGAAGTVVENFGVGSSVTIANNTVSFTPTADLAKDTVYHINYPSGSFTNTGGDVSYVGTGYTFASEGILYQLFAWGQNSNSQLGQNDITTRSSPIQIPGTTWSFNSGGGGSVAEGGNGQAFIKTDGTLWTWGGQSYGELGQNESEVAYSSPEQVGSDTTWSKVTVGRNVLLGTKTNGTLWTWGLNSSGELGQNNRTYYSSPVQIPGTTWATGVESIDAGSGFVGAIKTDGTLWTWGHNNQGRLGHNNTTKYSSPVQVPGTTWSKLGFGRLNASAIKTDGTLWSWGYNSKGELAQNNRAHYSSPVQCPGTTWSKVKARCGTIALKTDGTLWAWGNNDQGHLGQNTPYQASRSSPVQIPGTTWSDIGQTGRSDDGVNAAIKTDGTLWTWGGNRQGSNGINVGGDAGKRSSPTQVPGTTWYKIIQGGNENMYAFKQI